MKIATYFLAYAAALLGIIGHLFDWHDDAAATYLLALAIWLYITAK